MKLKAFVEKLDDVPEAFRDCYVEVTIDDKTIFKLNVEGIESHPDTKRLANALDRQKIDNRDLKSKLEAANAKLDDLPEDFDADEYRRLKETGGKHPSEDEITQRVTDRLERKHKPELEKVTSERDALKVEVETRERRDALTTSLTSAGVTDPTYLKAAMALLSPKVKVEVVDGKYVATAEDDVGTIPVAEFIKDWADTDEGKAFIGPRDSGGGGAGGGRAPINTGEFTRENFNYTKFAQLKKENPAKAREVAKACGKENYL